MPEHSDTERLDAIASGFCVSMCVVDGVEHWICLYIPSEPIIIGSSLREVIDAGIELRDLRSN